MKWNKLTTRHLDEEEKELYPYFDFMWDGLTPDIDEEVLVCTNGKDVYTDVWVDYSNGAGFDTTDVEDNLSIYWMRFPEPPVEE